MFSLNDPLIVDFSMEILVLLSALSSWMAFKLRAALRG